MSIPSKRTMRITVLVGFFVLSFAMYASSEAGFEAGTYTLLGLLIALMLVGIWAG